MDFTLAPGGSEEREIVAVIGEILGGSAPSGRYYFTGVLRLVSGTIAVKAGALELTK